MTTFIISSESQREEAFVKHSNSALHGAVKDGFLNCTLIDAI